jgi:hypothetical protein
MDDVAKLGTKRNFRDMESRKREKTLKFKNHGMTLLSPFAGVDEKDVVGLFAFL